MKLLNKITIPIALMIISGAATIVIQVQNTKAGVVNLEKRVDKSEKQIDQLHWYLIRNKKVEIPKELR